MERLLMAVREDEEAEPVRVDTSEPGRVVLHLDDGRTLDFDAVELASAAADREAA